MRTAPLNSRMVVQITPAGCPAPCDLGMHLSYDPRQPYEIHAQFEVTPGVLGVLWVLSRELLWDGIVAPIGDGDVRVGPDGPDRIFLALRSPDGDAHVTIPRRPLVAFLKATYSAVPAGSEDRAFDLDGEIAYLLGGTA